jgi:hypothetical protein
LALVGARFEPAGSVGHFLVRDRLQHRSHQFFRITVDGQLADFGPQPGDRPVPFIGRPALERGLAGGQEVVAPAGELRPVDGRIGLITVGFAGNGESSHDR